MLWSSLSTVDMHRCRTDLPVGRPMEAHQWTQISSLPAPQPHKHRRFHNPKRSRLHYDICVSPRSDQPPAIPASCTAAAFHSSPAKWCGWLTVVRFIPMQTLPCRNVTAAAVAVLCWCPNLQVPTPTLLWLLAATAAVSCIGAESLLPAQSQGGIAEVGAAAATMIEKAATTGASMHPPQVPWWATRKLQGISFWGAATRVSVLDGINCTQDPTAELKGLQ